MNGQLQAFVSIKQGVNSIDLIIINYLLLLSLWLTPKYSISITNCEISKSWNPYVRLRGWSSYAMQRISCLDHYCLLQVFPIVIVLATAQRYNV